MVFDVIPFYEVKSIWIGKCNEGRCLDFEYVKRAYSKCVENEICPGFVGSSQESALMFLRTLQGHRGIAGNGGGRRQSALRSSSRDGGSCLHAVSGRPT